jgi:O-antigen/teichoic acid export membrane protein
VSTVGLAKRYAIGASALTSQRVYRTGLTFLVSIVLARYLGPSGMGIWSYALF